ncbi:MAG TPA: ATP-binding protein [Terriglobales bacterium]|nr:ATP-binding protein [Terriglobales bacterium]
MKRVLLSWSSGKDSAWALHALRQRADVEVVGLLTTINAEADRVAMHAVRRELVEAQARAAGLPLTTLPLPWPCPNAEYERRMRRACEEARERGAEAVAFGDLFLQDVRAYRERQLAGTGLGSLFPLWGLPTAELAREMITSGLRARLTCVDTRVLPAEFAGREFDEALLRDLPSRTDPCGEKGEFHSFCHAGPMFPEAIPVEGGEVIVRDGFAFADLKIAGRLEKP